MANILLIEDYPSLQKIYQETLELEKHTVQLANSAQEALAAAKKQSFDIILLDLLLQQTWGFDFLAEFKPKNHPKTQIIIISNLFTVELLNKAMAMGAKHYLIKSEVTPKQLVNIVKSTLQQSSKHIRKKAD